MHILWNQFRDRRLVSRNQTLLKLSVYSTVVMSGLRSITSSLIAHLLKSSGPLQTPSSHLTAGVSVFRILHSFLYCFALNTTIVSERKSTHIRLGRVPASELLKSHILAFWLSSAIPSIFSMNFIIFLVLIKLYINLNNNIRLP